MYNNGVIGRLVKINKCVCNAFIKDYKKWKRI